MLRVMTVVQQIMTEFTSAVLEEEQVAVVTDIVLNLMKFYGLLEFIGPTKS
jgi:hypothetical protein